MVKTVSKNRDGYFLTKNFQFGKFLYFSKDGVRFVYVWILCVLVV